MYNISAKEMKVGRMVHLWMLQVIVLNLIILEASEAVDPTQGFIPVAVDSSNFQVQKPYNVPVNQRYSFSNGVHRFRVYSTDKPFKPGSGTLPRTEIRITGHDYTSGVWQFEGHGYVPSGTSGVCMMQVFGGSPTATTLQLRVYGWFSHILQIPRPASKHVQQMVQTQRHP